MKSTLTSLDLRRIVSELGALTGRRVDGLRLYPTGAYGMKFSKSKQRLIFDARGWVFTTEEGWEGIEPDQLCQKLNKELSGRTWISVEQVGFDRILRFSFEDRSLVLELFAGGNAIALDENGIILAAQRKKEFKSRKVAPGEKYVPPASVDPTQMDLDTFSSKILGSKSDIISTLAVPLGMGVDLARETCQRCGMDEHAKGSELSNDDIGRIHDMFKEIVSESDNSSVAFSDDETFSPVKLRSMTDPVERPALSACISLFYKRFVENAAQMKDEESAKSERIAAKQKAQIAEFEKRADECARAGDAIYANFEGLSRIMNEIKESKGRSLPEGFQVAKGSCVKTIVDGVEVVIDWREDINTNAARYYEDAKKLKAKVEGAREAMKRAAEKPKKKVRPTVALKTEIRPAWFEKFRWFVTSEGCLVIAGRNARDNELIVRRHLKSQDIYIHADLPGAPSTVIRGKCSEASIKEACAFAVCYSRAWMLGLASADAFWVLGEQVSTHAPPGEFLARGSFLITGRKNFVRDLPLRLALGQVEYEGVKRFVCAPEGSIPPDQSKLVVSPGTMNREEFVKMASEMIDAPPEVIERIVPGGNVTIVQSRGGM